MNHLGLAAQTLLVAYDPDTGRRPDLQRLAPALRATGLTELVQRQLLRDEGDAVRATGKRPSGTTAALLWEACRPGISWRQAISRGARDFVHDVERELCTAGLAQEHRGGVGPFRRHSVRPTTTGLQTAASLRARVCHEAAGEPGLAAIAVSLHTLGMASAIGSRGLRPDVDSLRSTQPPGVVRALERVALDRRVMLTS